ncbi:MAG: antitoxin MazE-like protein [Sphingosinicella sp.]
MNKPSKFARYRARKKAQGLRELRLWVPDVNAPGFQDRLDRQITAINASPGEAEVLRWSETNAVELWPDPD